MGKPIKTDDWWRQKVAQLEDLAQRASVPEHDVHYPKEGYWPAIKLVMIQYALGFYLPIMRKEVEKGNWDSLHFIDTCAGSGLTRLNPSTYKGEQVVKASRPKTLAGSALIGANEHRRCEERGVRAFDHYHFIEPHGKSAKALEARLLKLLPPEKFTIHNDEACDAIGTVVDQVTSSSRNPHYFAVIDPNGLTEVRFQEVKQLVGIGRGDVIFNFQYTALNRAPEAADRFFGKDSWPRGGKDQEMMDFFHREMAAIGRGVISYTDIKANAGRYGYELAYATVPTKGGVPWLKNYTTEINKRLGAWHGQDIERVLFEQNTLF